MRRCGIRLLRQIEAHASDAGSDRPGGVFLRDWHAIPEDHRNLMLAAAGIVLSGNRGSLQQQLAPVVEGCRVPALRSEAEIHEEPSQPLPFLELPYFNGLGGFTQDGREYATYLAPGHDDACAMGQRDGQRGLRHHGGRERTRLYVGREQPGEPAHTLAQRSRERSAIGSDLYARRRTRPHWTPTALPIREKDAYRARHGQGYTVFEHNSHAIGAGADGVRSDRTRMAWAIR